MTTRDKARLEPVAKRIDAIEDLACALWDADKGGATAALADCERLLKRLTRRAETLSGEYERVEIVQGKGPTIEFTGRMLCETSFETATGSGGLRVDLELWETKGGALVAVSATTPTSFEGRENVNVAVIEPQADDMAMRLAVMDHFRWHDRARSMARKALGWSLRMEVE